ncbi:MAG: hypothetical protein ABGY95_02200 [Rubritalea sp.]|uniref:hypothetical protein n=1 Tax=Rubritalea sp. TaxID=2109375 RepID=UPI003242EE83
MIATALYDVAPFPLSKLVNDLYIRLISATGERILLWALMPSIPSAAATRGDNTRRNSEKVILNSQLSGNYTLTVNHKDTLSGSPQYSASASTDIESDHTINEIWINFSSSM